MKGKRKQINQSS